MFCYFSHSPPPPSRTPYLWRQRVLVAQDKQIIVDDEGHLAWPSRRPPGTFETELAVWRTDRAKAATKIVTQQLHYRGVQSFSVGRPMWSFGGMTETWVSPLAPHRLCLVADEQWYYLPKKRMQSAICHVYKTAVFLLFSFQVYCQCHSEDFYDAMFVTLPPYYSRLHKLEGVSLSRKLKFDLNSSLLLLMKIRIVCRPLTRT